MVDENDKNISDELKAEIESDFAPITPIIYSSLEFAHQVVPKCIEVIIGECHYKDELRENKDDLLEKAVRINTFLYPPLMRAITQYLLNIKNIKTKKDTNGKISPNNWECDILSNNGLVGSCNLRSYKILKIFKTKIFDEESGEFKTVLKIPPPGTSRKKQRYLNHYHRNQFIMDFTNNGKAILPKHNALYLWNTEQNSFELYLACSKSCDANHVEAYFIDLIQHPILTIKPLAQLDEIAEDIILPKINLNIDLNLNKSNMENENQSREYEDDTDEDNLREQN